MGNINNLDNPNKYVQGSVWWRKGNTESKEGVQAGVRPVLIISNNTFNLHSPVVNCVTITSQLKDSPVHVPLHMTVDSHIQCEQIFTISKTELTDFMGIVSTSTLSSVKAKLRIQFDMSTDRNTELLNSIKRSVDELNTNPEIMNNIKTNLEMLNEKADNGFGLPETENDFLKLILNIEISIEKIMSGIEGLKSNNKEESKIEDSGIIQADNPNKMPDNKEEKVRSKRRNYTYEDKVFIADKNNPTEEIMKKYGYDKTTAYKMRTYFKKCLADGSAIKNSSQRKNSSQKDKRTYRKYTEEDKKFILDTNNSIETIMEKFGFKSKQEVYWKRNSLKKAAQANNNIN